MEIRILKERAKEIEIEAKEETILNPIKERLLKNENVVYAEYSREHPLLTNPKLYLKVKNGKARDTLIKAIEELHREIKSFRGQIEKKK
jgi:DNA-directed RNA polymerase subunit L